MNDNAQLALVPQRADIESFMTIGKTLAQSGFFADAREAAQAVVKVMAGAELGFPPIASMVGIYIVKGKVSLSANMIAAAIRRTGRYNYRVVRLDDSECSIEFFDGKTSLGTSTFTAADAKRAGTQNMAAFPRNMLFARAMSNGAKWFVPDIFGGPVYTPEELGERVNEDGEVVEAAGVREIPQPAQAALQAAERAQIAQPAPTTAPEPKRAPEAPTANHARSWAEGEAAEALAANPKAYKAAAHPWPAEFTRAFITDAAAFADKDQAKADKVFTSSWDMAWQVIARAAAESHLERGHEALLEVCFGVKPGESLTQAQAWALCYWVQPIGDAVTGEIKPRMAWSDFLPEAAALMEMFPY